MNSSSIEIEDKVIPFSVRHSSRAKRPNLRLKNGEITVTIPEGSGIDPELILKENRKWTLKHWEKAKEFREKVPERVFEDGEVFSVLGDRKTLVIESRRSNKVGDDILLAEHLVERTGVKDQLEKALREHAREVFKTKAEKYSDRIEGCFGKIFVRDQKTRWGSCSGKGNLNFNWRLILGPEHVLEYVVVHELAHLEHANHSDRFWSRVKEIYPEYKRSDIWLSENTAKLVFDKK